MSTLVSDARICRACANLVTTDATCPLCAAPTETHPEREATEHYCIVCAGGPFLSRAMHLVTWNEDPYTQDEDGDLCCICRKCAKKRNDDLK